MAGFLSRFFFGDSASPRIPEGTQIVPHEEPRTVYFSGYNGFRITDQLLNHLDRRLGPIGRDEALGVPAVLRGRNLICSVSTLPLEAVDADNRIQDHPLLRQIDPNVENVTTLAMTIEDLLFDAVAWWRVTARSSDDYPTSAVRYDPQTVSLVPPKDYHLGYLPSDLPTVGVIWMEGHPVPFRDVIRFSCPNRGLLTVGERAIRRAILLDQAADLYASNPEMRGFFTPTDSQADPGSDEEIREDLDNFARARRDRLYGYVPAALAYNQVQNISPAELQLAEMQRRADLALANAIGIDPEDLGINTTSRTYQNDTNRRKDRINDIYSSYMKTITDRLSMTSVTKRGVAVRFNQNDYLRSDPETRAKVQQIYVDMGVKDTADIQREEGIPLKEIEAPPAMRTPVPPTQISAIPDGAR